MDNYVCVHCGSPRKFLMKTYSPTILKLISCENCGNVADKYLEYDEVIILIDIILFNKQAYRHVLFNTKFQNHWKLALIILIAKTANECIRSQSGVSCHSKSSYESTIYSFSLNFLITISGESLYFFLVCGFFILYSNGNSSTSPFIQHIKIIWKAIISSSFGYFLLLPSLIWSGFQREINYIFIFVYTLLSHIQALTVVYAIQRPLLAGFLIFGSAANYLLCYFMRCLFDMYDIT